MSGSNCEVCGIPGDSGAAFYSVHFLQRRASEEERRFCYMRMCGECFSLEGEIKEEGHEVTVMGDEAYREWRKANLP